MVRRFLEGRARPRTLAYTYLATLLAAAGATLALLVSLLLRYLPHGLLTRAGLACDMEEACATPLPPWAGSTFSFLIGGVIVGLVLFAGVAIYGQTSSSTRRRLDVVSSAMEFPGTVPSGLRGRVYLVDDPAPVSYTIGFWRPQVIVSSGLLATLDADELSAALAHEEGHVAAADNLIVLVARTLALTFALVPGVGMAYARLRKAQERAADEFARDRTGDGLLVAASLTKFARSLLPPAPSRRVEIATTSFAEEGDVSERVRGLLSNGRVATSKRRLAAIALVFVVLVTTFAGSALAFTGVTLASRSDCSACHESRVASTGAATMHEDPSLHAECVDTVVQY
ncbi:MAG: M56 family metallopeptidase [Actinobacteria bacterium]|nr:M56 family metallopeptidase [Actinomycetota bacterium]